jgi:toxin ParE1/3/4
MSQYIFTASAKKDLKEITDYLVRYSPSAARKIKDKLQKQCERLAVFPQMGQSCEYLMPGLRSFPVENYLIFYCIISEKIVIVRILNGYRDLEAIFSNLE